METTIQDLRFRGLSGSIDLTRKTFSSAVRTVLEQAYEWQDAHV